MRSVKAAAVVVLAMLIPASSMSQPAPAPIVIVAMGDSTTAGTPGWQSPIEWPPSGRGNEESQYAYWLVKAHPEWTVLNRGVNGERSDRMLERFERDVLSARPRIVVIIAGVNDVYQGRSADEVTRSLRLMYERALRAGIRVLAGSIIPYNSATPGQNAAMHEVNEWIRGQTRRDRNLAFVDTRAATAAPEDLDKLVSSPDGLHPSVDGYRRMADAIQTALEAMLR